jgi:Protein of unknown function (DUF3363)
MKDAGHGPGRREPSSNWLEASSLPPTLHNLQADLSAQQTGIGPVVPQGARRQVKLVRRRLRAGGISILKPSRHCVRSANVVTSFARCSAPLLGSNASTRSSIRPGCPPRSWGASHSRGCEMSSITESYIVVDGIDGRAHYVPLARSVDVANLPMEGVVEVQRAANGRAADRTIAALADGGSTRRPRVRDQNRTNWRQSQGRCTHQQRRRSAH